MPCVVRCLVRCVKVNLADLDSQHFDSGGENLSVTALLCDIEHRTKKVSLVPYQQQQQQVQQQVQHRHTGPPNIPQNIQQQQNRAVSQQQQLAAQNLVSQSDDNVSSSAIIAAAQQSNSAPNISDQTDQIESENYNYDHGPVPQDSSDQCSDTENSTTVAENQNQSLMYSSKQKAQQVNRQYQSQLRGPGPQAPEEAIATLNSSLVMEIPDDLYMQDYPLRLEAWTSAVSDSAIYPIGSCVLDLGILSNLQNSQQTQVSDDNQIEGWIPLYDTMKGIVGSVNLSIKLNYVNDQSYQDRMMSSVGVRFFSGQTCPNGGSNSTNFLVESMLGFVEELCSTTDPEFNWRDLIRSSRASNEERLKVFYQTSMRTRRELGKQVLRMGGNAILGYIERSDIEGDTTDRLTVRCSGTAVRISELGHGMSNIQQDGNNAGQQSIINLATGQNLLNQQQLAGAAVVPGTNLQQLQQQQTNNESKARTSTGSGHSSKSEQEIQRDRDIAVQQTVAQQQTLQQQSVKQNSNNLGIMSGPGPSGINQMIYGIGPIATTLPTVLPRQALYNLMQFGSINAVQTQNQQQYLSQQQQFQNLNQQQLNLVLQQYQQTQQLPLNTPGSAESSGINLLDYQQMNLENQQINYQLGNRVVYDWIQNYHRMQMEMALACVENQFSMNMNMNMGQPYGSLGAQRLSSMVGPHQPGLPFGQNLGGPSLTVGQNQNQLPAVQDLLALEQVQQQQQQQLQENGVPMQSQLAQIQAQYGQQILQQDSSSDQNLNQNTTYFQLSAFEHSPDSTSNVGSAEGGVNTVVSNASDHNSSVNTNNINQQQNINVTVPVGANNLNTQQQQQTVESQQHSDSIQIGPSGSVTAPAQQSSQTPQLSSAQAASGNLALPLQTSVAQRKPSNTMSGINPINVNSITGQNLNTINAAGMVPQQLQQLQQQVSQTQVQGPAGGPVGGPVPPSGVPGAGGPNGPTSVTGPVVVSTSARKVKILTLQSLPIHLTPVIHGTVVCRAVKVISSKTTQDSRDAWWSELREEVKLHALSLGCDCIAGYSETVQIYEELMLLSAQGTALTILPISRKAFLSIDRPCAMVHISNQVQDAQHHPQSLVQCPMCGKGMVRNILLATMNPPEGLPIRGTGNLVEARVVRVKKKLIASDAHASEVSDSLPFLELEIHRQLLLKMKLRNYNCLFGLKMEIAIGPNLLVAVASATGFFCEALPSPPKLVVRPGAYYEPPPISPGPNKFNNNMDKFNSDDLDNLNNLNNINFQDDQQHSLQGQYEGVILGINAENAGAGGVGSPGLNQQQYQQQFNVNRQNSSVGSVSSLSTSQQSKSTLNRQQQLQYSGWNPIKRMGNVFNRQRGKSSSRQQKPNLTKYTYGDPGVSGLPQVPQQYGSSALEKQQYQEERGVIKGGGGGSSTLGTGNDMKNNASVQNQQTSSSTQTNSNQQGQNTGYGQDQNVIAKKSKDSKDKDNRENSGTSDTNTKAGQDSASDQLYHPPNINIMNGTNASNLNVTGQILEVKNLQSQSSMNISGEDSPGMVSGSGCPSVSDGIQEKDIFETTEVQQQQTGTTTTSNLNQDNKKLKGSGANSTPQQSQQSKQQQKRSRNRSPLKGWSAFGSSREAGSASSSSAIQIAPNYHINSGHHGPGSHGQNGLTTSNSGNNLSGLVYMNSASDQFGTTAELNSNNNSTNINNLVGLGNQNQQNNQQQSQTLSTSYTVGATGPGVGSNLSASVHMKNFSKTHSAPPLPGQDGNINMGHNNMLSQSSVPGPGQQGSVTDRGTGSSSAHDNQPVEGTFTTTIMVQSSSVHGSAQNQKRSHDSHHSTQLQGKRNIVSSQSSRDQSQSQIFNADVTSLHASNTHGRRQSFQQQSSQNASQLPSNNHSQSDLLRFAQQSTTSATLTNQNKLVQQQTQQQSQSASPGDHTDSNIPTASGSVADFFNQNSTLNHNNVVNDSSEQQSLGQSQQSKNVSNGTSNQQQQGTGPPNSNDAVTVTQGTNLDQDSLLAAAVTQAAGAVSAAQTANNTSNQQQQVNQEQNGQGSSGQLAQQPQQQYVQIQNNNYDQQHQQFQQQLNFEPKISTSSSSATGVQGPGPGGQRPASNLTGLGSFGSRYYGRFRGTMTTSGHGTGPNRRRGAEELGQYYIGGDNTAVQGQQGGPGMGPGNLRNTGSMDIQGAIMHTGTTLSSSNFNANLSNVSGGGNLNLNLRPGPTTRSKKDRVLESISNGFRSFKSGVNAYVPGASYVGKKIKTFGRKTSHLSHNNLDPSNMKQIMPTFLSYLSPLSLLERTFGLRLTNSNNYILRQGILSSILPGVIKRKFGIGNIGLKGRPGDGGTFNQSYWRRHLVYVQSQDEHMMLNQLANEYQHLFRDIDLCPIPAHDTITRINWIVEYHRELYSYRCFYEDQQLIKNIQQINNMNSVNDSGNNSSQQTYQQIQIQPRPMHQNEIALLIPELIDKLVSHVASFDFSLSNSDSHLLGAIMQKAPTMPVMSAPTSKRRARRSRLNTGSSAINNQQFQQEVLNLQNLSHNNFQNMNLVTANTGAISMNPLLQSNLNLNPHTDTIRQDLAAKKSFVFEVDDPRDQDLLSALDDPVLRSSVAISTVDCLPGIGCDRIRDMKDVISQSHMVYVIRRAKLGIQLEGQNGEFDDASHQLGTSYALSRKLSLLMNEIYASILFRTYDEGESDGGLDDIDFDINTQNVSGNLNMSNQNYQDQNNVNLQNTSTLNPNVNQMNQGTGVVPGGPVSSTNVDPQDVTLQFTAQNESDGEKLLKTYQNQLESDFGLSLEQDRINQQNQMTSGSVTANSSLNQRSMQSLNQNPGSSGPVNQNQVNQNPTKLQQTSNQISYLDLLKVRQVRHCLSAVSWRISLLEDDLVELVLVGQVFEANKVPNQIQNFQNFNPYMNPIYGPPNPSLSQNHATILNNLNMIRHQNSGISQSGQSGISVSMGTVSSTVNQGVPGAQQQSQNGPNHNDQTDTQQLQQQHSFRQHTPGLGVALSGLLNINTSNQNVASNISSSDASSPRNATVSSQVQVQNLSSSNLSGVTANSLVSQQSQSFTTQQSQSQQNHDRQGQQQQSKSTTVNIQNATLTSSVPPGSGLPGPQQPTSLVPPTIQDGPLSVPTVSVSAPPQIISNVKESIISSLVQTIRSQNVTVPGSSVLNLSITSTPAMNTSASSNMAGIQLVMGSSGGPGLGNNSLSSFEQTVGNSDPRQQLNMSTSSVLNNRQLSITSDSTQDLKLEGTVQVTLGPTALSQIQKNNLNNINNSSSSKSRSHSGGLSQGPTLSFRDGDHYAAQPTVAQSPQCPPTPGVSVSGVEQSQVSQPQSQAQLQTSPNIIQSGTVTVPCPPGSHNVQIQNQHQQNPNSNVASVTVPVLGPNLSFTSNQRSLLNPIPMNPMVNNMSIPATIPNLQNPSASISIPQLPFNHSNISNNKAAFLNQSQTQNHWNKCNRENGASAVFVTPLASIPNCRVKKYLGLISVHLIKETISLKKDYNASLQLFYNRFISEALDIARSQVNACGGNACLSYKLSNLFLKNDSQNMTSGKAYALVSICGDAAWVEGVE